MKTNVGSDQSYQYCTREKVGSLSEISQFKKNKNSAYLPIEIFVFANKHAYRYGIDLM
jgi:hypothetical protein